MSYMQLINAMPQLLRSAANSAFAGKLAVCIGLGMLVIGAVMFVRELLTCTRPVQAVCVDVVSRRKRKGGTTFTPVWQYEYGGRVFRESDSFSSNMFVPRVGNTYTLYVNPSKPEKFRRKGVSFPVMLMIFGAVFTVFALLTA